MRGLDPRIHQSRIDQLRLYPKKTDCRVTPGNDDKIWPP